MRIMMLDHTQILRRHSPMFRLCLWSSTQGGGLFQGSGAHFVLEMVFVEKITTYYSHWIISGCAELIQKQEDRYKVEGFTCPWRLQHGPCHWGLLYAAQSVWIDDYRQMHLPSFPCFDVFFYRNAKKYPPLTTFHPNPSQPIPPPSVRYDLTIPSKVEKFGRCKGLPTMERIGEGRTRAVTGNDSMKLLSSPLYSSTSSSLPSSLWSLLIGYAFMFISASWSEILGGDVIICGGRTRLARYFCSDDLLRLPFVPNY